jgi:hypothetical protein
MNYSGRNVLFQRQYITIIIIILLLYNTNKILLCKINCTSIYVRRHIGQQDADNRDYPNPLICSLYGWLLRAKGNI